MQKAASQVCERFNEKECGNVFMGAGFETEEAQCAAIRLLSADILAGDLAAGQKGMDSPRGSSAQDSPSDRDVVDQAHAARPGGGQKACGAVEPVGPQQGP